jgi:hypothetical protein
MKTRKATIFFATAVFAIAAQAQVRGSPSCGSWTQERTGTRPVIENATWLLGLLSGVSFMSKTDFLRGTDNDSIYLWVDNYCKAQPLKFVFDAGMVLSVELTQQKKL